MVLDIKKHWNIDKKDIEELPIRNDFSKSRFYLVDKKYILKQDDSKYLEEKKKELRLLKKLKNINILLPIQEKIVEENKDIYQLFDFVKKDKIDYDKDAETIAAALAEISKQEISGEKETITDSLCRIEKTFVKRANLDIVRKCFMHLNKDFFPFLPYYNFRFSHGDLHPDNILMEKDEIKAIIDWDLAKDREELYDLAFIIGCIGIENPTSLLESSTKKLIRRFAEKTMPNKLAFTLLPEMVLALRLKWMHKWIIKDNDKEIMEMEADFLEMLLENIEKIRKLWLSYLDTDFKHSDKRWVMQDAFLVKDIEKAKEFLGNFDIDEFSFDQYQDKELLSTSLRLIGIDFGMKDELVSHLKVRHLLETLSNSCPEEENIMIERVIAMGNSCLDLSKFNLIDAIEMTIKEAEMLIRQKNIPELNIGYAFMLRNASIAYAENKRFEKIDELLPKLKKLSDNTAELEIKGEYSRALSNAITSLLELKDKKEEIDKHFSELKDLYDDNPDFKKIQAAYHVAKTNIEKSKNL